MLGLVFLRTLNFGFESAVSAVAQDLLLDLVRDEVAFSFLRMLGLVCLQGLRASTCECPPFLASLVRAASLFSRIATSSSGMIGGFELRKALWQDSVLFFDRILLSMRCLTSLTLW